MSTATLAFNVPFEVQRNTINSIGLQNSQTGLSAYRQLECIQGFSYTSLSRPMFYSKKSYFPQEALLTTSECCGLVGQLRLFYQLEHLKLSDKLSHRLVELLTLESGWDGEKAQAPKPEILARITRIISLLKKEISPFTEPFLTPTIEGYAQLEWRNLHRYLEIEAMQKGWSIVGSEISPKGDRIYHVAEANFHEEYKLLESYQWVAKREMTWPI